jgi:hypothetical protein
MNDLFFAPFDSWIVLKVAFTVHPFGNKRLRQFLDLVLKK